MIDTKKTDSDIGKRVHKHLQFVGIETPMTQLDSTEGAQIDSIAEDFSSIMKTMRLNLRDDSLQDTPNRVAKMFINEICYGLNYANFPKISSFEKPTSHDGAFVLVKQITVQSLCEHHFVPFIGHATIAYIPNQKIVGLSKLNRVVDFFCRRPQVQERLTEQIKEALTIVLDTKDVAVFIDAEHLCVKIRGVGDQHSRTSTLATSGAFAIKDGIKDVRDEFLSYIHDGQRR